MSGFVSQVSSGKSKCIDTVQKTKIGDASWLLSASKTIIILISLKTTLYRLFFVCKYGKSMKTKDQRRKYSAHSRKLSSKTKKRTLLKNYTIQHFLSLIFIMFGKPSKNPFSRENRNL